MSKFGDPDHPDPKVAGAATAFQPGESGNPAGKPKGSKHITTWIQELLNDENFEANILDPKIGIKEYKGAPIKAIIQVATVKAVNGDPKAMDLLMKYGWSAKQEIDLTSLGNQVGQPIDQNLLTQFLMNVENNTKR